MYIKPHTQFKTISIDYNSDDYVLYKAKDFFANCPKIVEFEQNLRNKNEKFEEEEEENVEDLYFSAYCNNQNQFKSVIDLQEFLDKNNQ
jgi:hypothetical protein